MLRSLVVSVWALFLGLALVMVGNGLQGSVLGVRSEAEGFGVAVGGLVMACYFAGFLVGSHFATHALGTVGHIRVFAALASTASSVALMHAVFPNPVVWALLRFVFGLCIAGLYVVVESWLNQAATNETRGRLLSIYMVVSMGGYAAGQALLPVADTNGYVLFVLASILVSISLVPVTLSAATAPPISLPEPMSISKLIRLVPTGVVTVFFVGTAAGTLLGMGAIYAATVGMTTGRISTFLIAPMLGAIVGQIPIGWLSDRVSRRIVILVVSSAAAVSAAVPLMVDTDSAVVVLMMFALGAFAFPLYSLAIAYTNDWLPPEGILGASGALVRINGAGAVVGPVVAALVMARWGPSWFFWGLVLPHLAVACFVMVRIFIIEAPDVSRQRPHVAFPARSTVAVALLHPRRRRPGDNPRPKRRRPRASSGSSRRATRGGRAGR
jgi:MFS family permease